ncbi:MAG: LacI family DNA-binding transcriptional regulator [Sneathiellaceae bacterium]
MTATIHDVAQRAGCSIASVSRVLNGSAAISPDLESRVRAAVEALGYRPNALGRSLKTKATRAIGMLVPSFTNPVFAASLAGVEQAARAAGYDIILSATGYDRHREPEAVAAMTARAVEGLILTVADAEHSVLLDALDRNGPPYVLLYNELSRAGRAAVAVDNAAAVTELVGHMVALGHRRIAFVAGRFRASDRSRLRYQGYLSAMAAAGLEPLPVAEVEFLGVEPEFDRDLAGLLARRDRPTAFACSNDLLAIAVMAALRRVGLSVPADVSVTGFDGIAIGRQIAPSLATIEAPTLAMGRAALDLLLDIRASRAPRATRRLPHRFRPGESLAAAPACNPAGAWQA